MTKTRWESDVVNLISLVYAETKIELSGLVWPNAIYDENQIRQWCDQWYKCILHWKRYSTITTDATHGSLALKAYQQNLYLEYYY